MRGREIVSDLTDAPMLQRIRGHLADLPGDIGCRHLARERDGVAAALLGDLHLVKPIMSRVPTCTAHGCPRCGACPWEADFLPDASGAKAGVKYRRTPEGEAVAAGKTAAIVEAIENLALAKAILTTLEGGPSSLFALQWGLVEEARSAVRAGRNSERVAPDRPVLIGVVRMLADLGVIALQENGTIFKL